MAHEYTATVSWKRGDGEPFTDLKFSRAHQWAFDGGVTVPGSSSPLSVKVPYSRVEAVDPEEALVAALSSCHMLTFLFLAAKGGFVVDAYDDEAVGIMTKNERGKLYVSKVTLRPRIAFSGARRPSAAELGELSLHRLLDGPQVMRVVGRVFEQRRRQRAARPVGFLSRFRQRHAAMPQREIGKALLVVAEHLRRDHRVEDLARAEIGDAADHADIEISALEDQELFREDARELRQVHLGQRVDHKVLALDADLQQAELLLVMVQTVGLRVHGGPGRTGKHGGGLVDPGLCIDIYQGKTTAFSKGGSAASFSESFGEGSGQRIPSFASFQRMPRSCSREYGAETL